MKYDCILVAAGSGTRAKLGYNKVLYKLDDETRIIDKAASEFLHDSDCQKLIVVNSDEVRLLENDKRIVYTNGGKTRFDSVSNGLKLVTSPYVLIHDGARPFLSSEELTALKNSLSENDAAILALKCKDSVKLVKDSEIVANLNRDEIYLALTPQGFKTELLNKAYSQAKETYNDESSMLVDLGYHVKVVLGSPLNQKVTYFEDFQKL